MKYLLRNIACAIMLLFLFNCATEPVDNIQDDLSISATQPQDGLEAPSTTCSAQDPKARLTNNGTLDVSFQIYSEDGTMMGDEHDVEPGETSDWESFEPGETVFVVSNGTSEKIIVIDMGTCMAYDMEIGSNNQLTSDQPVHY